MQKKQKYLRTLMSHNRRNATKAGRRHTRLVASAASSKEPRHTDNVFNAAN